MSEVCSPVLFRSFWIPDYSQLPIGVNRDGSVTGNWSGASVFSKFVRGWTSAAIDNGRLQCRVISLTLIDLFITSTDILFIIPRCCSQKTTNKQNKHWNCRQALVLSSVSFMWLVPGWYYYLIFHSFINGATWEGTILSILENPLKSSAHSVRPIVQWLNKAPWTSPHTLDCGCQWLELSAFTCFDDVT